MLSINTIRDAIGSSRELLNLPRADSPACRQSQVPQRSPAYRSFPFYHTPTTHPPDSSMRRTSYRLSEGRTNVNVTDPPDHPGTPVRTTIRQPLDTISLEYYGIYQNMQFPENRGNESDRSYHGRPIETSSSQAVQVGAISQGNQSAQVPSIRPRLSRPSAGRNNRNPLDIGLLTFRMESNGQSAIVIRHSEGLFQPGQLVGYQAELASSFESKLCPICQEEWIWRIFTPAEMALLDPSGAEWEVARLPCGHAFHGACLAVWFHEISVINPHTDLTLLIFDLYGSPSCPCCRRQYRFREYRWSEAFCYEGWRLRYNWAGDREESSPEAYLNGRPHYPSISRRVSFTIRSQSEEQPGTPYISDSGQGSHLPPRRRHPSWTTLSSSGGGTILRRTRRTSRYVSDTLNALGESSIVTLPEESTNLLMVELDASDLQALTPDMILYEPEYWNRYELELGEEGEGGTIGYEKMPQSDRPSGDDAGSSWPHLEAYITTQVGGAVFSPSKGEKLEEPPISHPTVTREGALTRGTSAPEASNQPAELNLQAQDSNVLLNKLLSQWNTQSTIGDVLRDFHWIIAYVLEGMQQYEAGMAPWPRVPQDFDQRMRNYNPEETEGNISIASASRRVLSILESTGIPQADLRQGSVASRASRIPRLVKRESKGDPIIADEASHAKGNTGQVFGPGDMGFNIPLNNIGKAGVNTMVAITPDRAANVPDTNTNLTSTIGWSLMEDTCSKRGSTSRSPDKKEDLRPRIADFGYTGSKIPVLSPRPGGGNISSVKTEIPTPKCGERSPIRGRRGRLMAEEMQAPTDLYFSRGQEITCEYSPLASKTNLIPPIAVHARPGDVTYLENVEEEKDGVVEEINEKKKKKDEEQGKENRHPDA